MEKIKVIHINSILSNYYLYFPAPEVRLIVLRDNGFDKLLQ